MLILRSGNEAGMKRYVKFIVIGASLFILLSASVVRAGGGEDTITLSSAPAVVVSLSNNTTFNVTYSEVFVETSLGVVGASLADQAWNISNSSAGYIYRSGFELKPVAGSDSADIFSNIMNLSKGSFLGNDSTPSLQATAMVKISHYNGPVSVLAVRNATGLLNGSISNVNLSTLKLSFSISFNLSAYTVGNGSVNVVLTQSISGGDKTSSFEAEGVDAYENSSDLGSGVALLNSSVADLKAVYWWNNNYTYNGNNGSDYSVLMPGDNSTQVAFVFKTTAIHGQYTLSQDPYLSVNGANMAGINIQAYTQHAISFLLQHIEFFGAGIAGGSVALVALYGVYRKNKIDL